jgi:epoxyqueuosine reductase
VERPRTDSFWEPFRSCFEAEGFPASSAVDWAPVQKLYSEHSTRYADWIAGGKHGEMSYLARGLDRRLNPELVFPGLKSAITVLRPYSAAPVGDESLRYARYLNGPDYHDELKTRLERAMNSLLAKKLVPDDFSWKVCVDTSAVLERSWAALSGLGWIGKNTLLIHPQLGSYVFIGVVFTNHEFGEGPNLLRDYCGPCTRCLSSCPTEALNSHDLDSRKCISYLTLEKRGDFETALPLKGFVAGCDLCQEACPYNTKAVRKADPKPTEPYLVLDEVYLSAESELEYKTRVSGTALSRIKFKDFKRNLFLRHS